MNRSLNTTCRGQPPSGYIATLGETPRPNVVLSCSTWGDPQDRSGFARCSTWGDPKTAVAHRTRNTRTDSPLNPTTYRGFMNADESLSLSSPLTSRIYGLTAGSASATSGIEGEDPGRSSTGDSRYFTNILMAINRAIIPAPMPMGLGTQKTTSI